MGSLVFFALLIVLILVIVWWLMGGNLIFRSQISGSVKARRTIIWGSKISHEE